MLSETITFRPDLVSDHHYVTDYNLTTFDLACPKSQANSLRK